MISNSKPEAGSNHEISVPESQGAIDRGGLFLGILFGLALVWGLLGCVILGSPSESAATMDFLKVYLFFDSGFIRFNCVDVEAVFFRVAAAPFGKSIFSFGSFLSWFVGDFWL
jgi:hypothetical protein